MSRNLALNKAKSHVNDNLYTRYEDVAVEIPNYSAYLRDKRVYCPCDNPRHSQFWRYLHEHFAELGLRSLTATFSTAKQREREEEYAAIYLGGDDEDIMSFDAHPLCGDGDFLSDECLEVMSKNDIVITNPPFSLGACYINKLMNLKTPFIIIGPETLFGNRHVFQYFATKTIKVGFNSVKKFTDEYGNIKTFGNTTWLHSIPGIDNIRPLKLTRRYEEGSYDRFLNYPDVINVNRIKDIPADYSGIMAVPITFIKYYDPSRFSIVALKNGTQKSTRLYVPSKTSDEEATAVYSRLFVSQSHGFTPPRGGEWAGLLKGKELTIDTGKEVFARIVIQSSFTSARPAVTADPAYDENTAH